MREAAYLRHRPRGHRRQSFTFYFSETYLMLLPLHSRLWHRRVSKPINKYTQISCTFCFIRTPLCTTSRYRQYFRTEIIQGVPKVTFPKRKEKKRKEKERKEKKRKEKKKQVYRNLRILYHGSYSAFRITLLQYKKAKEKHIETALNGFKQVLTRDYSSQAALQFSSW